MSTPDFGRIEAEAGLAAHDGIQSLWLLINNAIIDEARALQITRNQIEPKVLVSSTTSNTDNLNLQGSSVVHFTGGLAFNLTGFLAPEPGKARFLIVYNSGAGTITLKHELTSAALNQLSLITAADTTVVTRGSAMFVYLSGKWRQV